MQRISITNPQNVIDGTAKKYYFKLRNTGGPKGDKGDKGDTGSRGPQGEPGNAATVYVGSTTTLEVGQDATVENVGTQYNAVLNFGIPQGPRGPQGIQGERGEPGQTGQTGPRGPQGEKGTNATVYVGTTTTTNPGTQARVYNSGTDSNAVLNFEIPRGDVGPQPELVQTTGTSTTKAMSQKATTDALNTKQNTIDSSHKLSAGLVDDTSTTNKFVTASEKATWNAKQNALTAGDNITISGDTISTPAIAPEVVAELPETGAEGKLYLTPKNYTRSTATGNPITATVAEDAGALESFQLDGDTFQQTYSGKNLIDGIFRQGNKQDLKTTNRIFTTQNLPVESGVTYTISTTLDTTIYKYAINIATAPFPQPTENVPYDSGWITSDTFSFTPSINGYLGIIVAYSNGTTGLTPSNISGVKWQLEKSSSASSYEPYVGGVPSPNPDYPQAVQTVTGEQTVEIVGKNLFDKNTSTPGVLDGDGTIGSSIDYFTSDFIRVVPETMYHKTQTTSARFKFYNINKTPISSVYNDIPSAGDAQSFTTPSNCYYIRFSFKFNTKNSIQIELGSTATSYAPYSKQTYPINLGKNLFDKNNATIYKAYIWTTEFVLRENYTDRTFLIPCLPNTTYTISRSIKTSSFRASYLDSDVAIPAPGSEPSTTAKYTCAQYVQNNTGSSITITTGANADRLIVHYGNTASDTNINESLATIQVEVGSQATAYAPYFTPIELCKLGTYQDYIWKDGEDWKVHKATDKASFSGLSWVMQQTGSTASYRIRTSSLASLIKTPSDNNTPTAAVCNYYLAKSAGQTYNREQGISVQTTGSVVLPGWVTIYDNTYNASSSLDSWKATSAYASGLLYYPLATATDTIITDQALIAQLEAIRTASLENGSNTITNSTPAPNLAGDMEIGYYGYNPTNRYDKFIWLDLNNNYEQIGE